MTCLEGDRQGHRKQLVMLSTMSSFSLTHTGIKDANFGTVSFVCPQSAYSETTSNELLYTVRH